jgi:hypothetical protein
MNVPSGIYFASNNFSFSAWVYFRQFVNWYRVIDFGNGPNQDNILLTSEGSSNKMRVDIYTPSGITHLTTSQSLSINASYHILFTLNGNTGSIYINGALDSQISTFPSPRAISRRSCYIGKSSWSHDSQTVNAIYDEIKIFNQALSLQQVKNEYNYGSCKNFL